MRKQFYLAVIFSASTLISIAQSPQLSVDGKTNNGVSLQSLKIDIKVCGTVARTTWQMTFKNTTSRILEGNLNFPLKEGISVSRYALDINGKMREAVPVDRGKATVVFEAIERRRVDPGLLEKLDGNVFRTRIYPIPVNGTRTVIIGYEEELPILSNNLLQYFLPLDIKDTVGEFSVNLTVIQTAAAPVIESSCDEKMVFEKRNNVYSASLKKNNYIPSSAVAFSIPKPADAAEVLLQPYEGKYCYLINTPVQKNEREKILPASIGLIWDASLSGLTRNTKKELEFLDAYFKKVNNASIVFQSFNNKAGSVKNYALINGDWTLLRRDIEAIVYDGATNFGNLNLAHLSAGEFILVSDGRQTLGNNAFQLGNKPVHCINSSVTADFSRLKFVSLKTGGIVIDLQREEMAAALKKMLTETYRFLGIKKKDFIIDHFPSMPVAVNNNFSLAGIAKEDITEVTLQFGYGSTVTYEKTVTINAETQLCTDFDITRIYAQKKITELDITYEQNKTEIERLGKEFGIVTRNTSLIVLETINDYLQYEIEPPAELRAEYERSMKQRRTNIITRNEDNQRRLSDMSYNLMRWYDPKKAMPTQKQVSSNPIPPTQPVTVIRSATTTTATTPQRPNNGANVIGGTVTDANGNPVSFATVRIKGSNVGLSADQNGSYSLNARPGDVLVISGPGFRSVEVPLGSQTNISIPLERGGTELREVVVTGAFGTKRAARSTASNVQNISGEQLNTIRTQNINDALAGKVSGLQVRSQSAGKLGVESYVRLRGENGLGVGSGPIYVVDGTIIPSSSDISPDDIEDVTVLQGPAASALFGPEGSNGAIVINTKRAKRNSGYSGPPVNTDENDDDDASIKLNNGPTTAAYLTQLRQAAKENRYAKYLELRSSFMDKPVYFFDVAGFFLMTGDPETGLKILSNLAEMENANYELYKMLGYKLKEAGDYVNEVAAFKKVLELRPLDPQSYRDYALALEDVRDYQQALLMLYEGLEKSNTDEMRRIYGGIEEIFLMEIQRLISLHRSELNLDNIDKTAINEMPVDLRIVMNWNMNNSDIDLWVTDPSGEKCYYGHNSTAIGGRISRDFTQGFGPEQFMLKKGMKGKYKIQINYFGNSQVTIAGPATVMAEIYLHYGTSREQKRIITLQMKKDGNGEVFIGEVEL